MEAPALAIPEIDGASYVEVTPFEENGDKCVNGPDIEGGDLSEGGEL